MSGFAAMLLGIYVSYAQTPERQFRRVSELTGLPSGLYLPMRIGKTLRSGKTQSGSAVVVEATQRVPVSENSYLDRDVRLSGEVVSSTAGDGTAKHPAVLSIHFSSVSYRGKAIPVVTRAVALANLVDVGATSLPATGSTDRGNSNAASWTTRQVGGDEVYRSGWVGDVCDSTMRKVGFADFYGVYSLPVTMDGQQVPRAMGVFSTNSQGLYGYEHGATLESSAGTITITSPEKRVVLRNGDNLLLEVVQH